LGVVEIGRAWAGGTITTTRGVGTSHRPNRDHSRHRDPLSAWAWATRASASPLLWPASSGPRSSPPSHRAHPESRGSSCHLLVLKVS
jgi:hypothetical protein